MENDERELDDLLDSLEESFKNRKKDSTVNGEKPPIYGGGNGENNSSNKRKNQDPSLKQTIMGREDIFYFQGLKIYSTSSLTVINESVPAYYYINAKNGKSSVTRRDVLKFFNLVLVKQKTLNVEFEIKVSDFNGTITNGINYFKRFF